jgi:hypothetical protein
MKKNTIYLLFIMVLVFATPKLYAQYYDCNTAIRICDALESDLSMNLDQIGAPDLSNGNDGCLSGETNGSGWFYLETTGTGLLGFDLIASDINDDFTDVDFAVYGPFNMIELNNGTLCTVINNNTEPSGRSNPIRCSYADDANYCFSGTNNTGLDSGVANDVGCGNNTSEFSETGGGNGFVSSISATPGQVYMVYVDDFSGTTANFLLTFTLLTHSMVSTECGESPCTCANGGSCPGNHYADETSADVAYNAIVNEDDAPCYDLTPEGISTADGTYQFCYTYTTGATEEYMGAAMTAFLDETCITNGGITSNVMRLYPVVAGSCGAAVTSAGTTPLGYSYYDVTPSTTYKLCQELTINPLTTGCDIGRFGSVCPLLFAYEPCFLTLGTETRTCNPEGTEYTLTVPFTGGGTRSYTIIGATNNGDNPSSMATGTMSFGPFTQGTSYSINITGGTCDLDVVGSYTCIPPCDFAPETIANFSVTCGNSATLNIGDTPALYGFGDIGEFAGSCTEISSTGHTAVTLADDAVTADLNIGFSFSFFGNTYTQFRIHSNGFISFGGQTYTGYANFSIPNATDPDNFIAGLYGDLNPSCGGSVRYSTIGSAPNRQLVVTFSDIEPYESGCNAPATEAVSFQIVLNEDGSFYVVIIDYPPTYGASTTIASNVTSGYENADGTIADAATGYNGQSGAWVDESAGALPKCWGAYPLTNPCVFDRWEDGTGATIGTTASLSVTPSVTTTYTAVWNCAGTECTDPLTVTVTGTPPTTTGATICTGGSGTLTSSVVCPDVAVPGSPIAQGATFNSGTLTTADARWTRNAGGTTCNATATDSEYYDIFTFTVSANGSYTLNMCTPGTNWDGHASLYQNAFSDSAPCGVPANFIIADDDGNSGGNCDNDARLTATLSTGITYYLITTEFSASGANRAYAWTFTGPASATISPVTTAPGTLQWYTAATGGTPVQTGSPFNPVGDAEVIAAGAPYSSLTNTNTPGTYTFYAACSGAPNCRAATNFVINAGPSVTASNNGPLTCTKTSVTLSPSAASGTITYAWPGGLTSVSTAGTYTVTATDGATGCTATASTVVAADNTAPSAPTGTLAITNSTCSSCTVSGGSILIGSVTGTGGTLEYSTDGGTTWSASLPSYAPPQTIIASVLAANGCRSTTTTVGTTVAGTCVPPSAPTGTLAITNSTCGTGCVVGGGSIAIGTVSGTGGTLQYSTDGGTTWSAILPSYAAPQTIIASVLGTNGCRSTTTAVGTTVAGSPCTNPTFTGTASCAGGANTGVVSQSATGGSGSGYTYSITGGSFGSTLANGTYNVSVTDGNGCSTTSNVVVNCVDLCPVLTAAAPAVQVTNSTCTSCTVGGGSITAPVATCPTGSTLQYSTDNGASWSTVLPTYNQTSAITVLTRCNCNANTATSSPTSSVTTVPGTCTTPSAPTGTLAIVNSTCGTGCTVSGGSIGAGTVTGTGGTVEYSTNGGTTWSASLPTYAAPQTIMASVLGTNGCRSASATVGTTVAGTCTTPAFTSSSASLCVNATRTLAASPAGGTFSLVSGSATVVGTTLTATGAGAIVVQYTATNGCTITQNITATTCGTRTITISDPCSCNNDATTLTNGTFNETVELSELITGDVLTVTAISGLYASPGVAYTPTTATAALLVTLPTAHLSGIHTDNVGYSITVHVSNTTPGLEFEGDYSVGNKCAYPNPDFTLPVTTICSSGAPITLTATHTDAGPAGVGVFSGAGVSGTTFTPSVAGVGGPYIITLTYTGGNDGLGGVSPDGGTVPAYPGCVQPIGKTISVMDCCGANAGSW